MSSTLTMHAHIAYELIDEAEPSIVVVEFVSRVMTTPSQARELGDQLHSLIRPELPNQFVLDFRNVRTLGSTGFGAIAAFVRDVRKVGGRVKICNIDDVIKLGAKLIGLDDVVEFADDRKAAIHEYMDVAARGRLIRLIAQYHN